LDRFPCVFFESFSFPDALHIPPFGLGQQGIGTIIGISRVSVGQQSACLIDFVLG